MPAHRTFRRSFDALQDIFLFTADFFAREHVDPGLLPTVDLTVEELFTNMVKYSPASDAEMRIDVATFAGGVEVTLTDYDVELFDATRAPDVDINLPIEQRKPGGWMLAIDFSAGGVVVIAGRPLSASTARHRST